MDFFVAVRKKTSWTFSIYSFCPTRTAHKDIKNDVASGNDDALRANDVCFAHDEIINVPDVFYLTMCKKESALICVGCRSKKAHVYP